MKALLEILEPGTRDWQLARSLDPARMPAHVAVIMDGNGRWATRRSLPRVAGHKAAVEPVRVAVETCARLGLESLTLYAFSKENWKRPKAEVETLWRLLTYYLRREVPRLMANNIRMKAIGRTQALPEKVQQELAEAIQLTSSNTGMILNLAINYSGRTEIVDAVNRLVVEARNAGTLDRLVVDEQAIERMLDTAGQSEPDLLIRTSGEMRISNFLLWQIAYAELYVTEICWPDFDRTCLLEAIAAYQKRDRRFGGLRAAPADKEAETEAVSAPIR
jgi:undecaprenyl diphosphate synthase